jgi:phospholipase/carboxylesterase
MRASMHEGEHEVILGPADASPDAAVIWLHGLGADGYDFVPLIPELQLPAAARVRFIFPHAQVRPVTINNGYAMRAWYDIRDLTPAGRDDEEGFAAARSRIEAYIAHERGAGIDSRRIVLAGFSQGGAVALHVGLRHTEPLAGILALSCYLPQRTHFAAELAAANRATPILMCHGSADEVVDSHFGEISCAAMRAEGLDVDWRLYPMGHSLCEPEVRDIAGWLALRLGFAAT